MIKIIRDSKTTTFENLEDGTLFFAVYEGDTTDYETIFLKIPLVNEKPCGNPTSTDNLNAVVVVGDETGSICRFEPYEDVIPIYNATVTIGG